jgi:putative thioredoxin
MIDITTENFETEVLLASQTVPVLVDFWAPWCGPCKSLSPVLEKLEANYGGRFVLAKVNSDEQQQLSTAFGIRSLPTCVLLMNGKPVDGFMGALPEGKLREFLDKHLPSEDALEAEVQAQEALEELEAGDVEGALERLAQALEKDPANDDARFDYIKLLIQAGQFGVAASTLAPTLTRIPASLRFEALQQWLKALEFVSADARGQWPMSQFDALIAANKRDFDARFDKSRVLIAQGAWTQALDELLEIIMRDKSWGEQAPRKTFVALLELMTPPKTKAGPQAVGKSAGGIELAGHAAVQEDEQSALVSAYRRKLSMALN